MFFNWKIRSPDRMALYRFHNEIVVKKAYELLLKDINKELRKHQVMVKIGVILYACITVNTFSPRGDPTSVVENRKEEKEKQVSQKSKGKKETQSGVDTQGKWLKKSGKLYYGYKKHIGGGG
ncbi:MAG: hypothetical protein ACMUEL_07525 [Flavobacteriales bacterium Tduv]